MTTTRPSRTPSLRRRALAAAAIVMVGAVLSSCAVRGSDVAPAPAASIAPSPSATPAPATPTPDRAAALALADRVLSTYAVDADVTTADAQWSWAAYFMAVSALAAETDSETGTDPERWNAMISAWGAANSWLPDGPESRTSNPDDRAAIQVWSAAAESGASVDLAESDRLMAQDLSLPAERYWWIDSMFMGLPNWAEWTQRTGDPQYAARIGDFYTFLRTDGGPSWLPECGHNGLFDESEGLWWRDCRFVDSRDELGHKVLWARGNGWVMAALVRTMAQLPEESPQRAELASMLTVMAAKIATLQGEDGLWRSSLLSPTLFPEPETSGSALFIYALASGIASDDLDASVYLPVVDRAWAGISSTLVDADGRVTNCQDVGDQPAAPSTTAVPPFCVGAVALAAVAVAGLSG